MSKIAKLISHLESEIAQREAAIKALRLIERQQPVAKRASKRGKHPSAASKAASARMKRYWRERKRQGKTIKVERISPKKLKKGRS